MKRYVNSKCNLKLDIPDEWIIQSEKYPFFWNIYYLFRLGYIPKVNIEFANDKIETFNINITILNPAPSPEECERIFLLSNSENIYDYISFGRFLFHGKEHTVVKYRFVKQIGAKKYMIVKNEKGYAITASSFDLDTYLEREPIWDEIVGSMQID